MNGIEVKLAQLETKLEERHINIEEKFERIDKKLDKIFDWLERLPCESQKTKINGLTASTNWLWRAFFSVVVGGIILGIWVKAIIK